MNLEKLIKAVKIQEDINMATSVIVNNQYYGLRMINYIKNCDFFNNDVIDFYYAVYYLNNKNNINNQVNGVVNFIEDYMDNKEMLHNCFMKNDGLAITLVQNYILNELNEVSRSDLIKKCDKEMRTKILDLSFVCGYVDLKYITDYARYTSVFLAEKYLDESSKTKLRGNIFLVDDVRVLMPVMIGDAYTYMNLNNDSGFFNSFIKKIENKSSNMNNLLKYVIADRDLFKSFLIYQVNLFLEYDYYNDAYKQAENQNRNFSKVLKKVNPFVIMDYVDYGNREKYRK